MDIVNILISLVVGGVGGNVAGALLKNFSLGTVMNTRCWCRWWRCWWLPPQHFDRHGHKRGCRWAVELGHRRSAGCNRRRGHWWRRLAGHRWCCSQHDGRQQVAPIAVPKALQKKSATLSSSQKTPVPLGAGVSLMRQKQARPRGMIEMLFSFNKPREDTSRFRQFQTRLKATVQRVKSSLIRRLGE